MKKTKVLSLLLVVLMLMQLVGMGGISVASAAEVNNTTLEIAEGKQAVVTAKVTRTGSENASIKLGTTEIFFISGKTMKLCNSTVSGEYGAGEYTVTAYINPAQKMTTVEVTLPDGGVVRRGTHEITGDVISVNAIKASVISDVSVTYENISVAEYTIVETEPNDTVFEKAKLRNLSVSFDDPATTRLFAFTGVKKFVKNDAAIALNYREKGATEWITVDAVRMEEDPNVDEYDYFKVDLTGLNPGTEYEYQIGKKGSTSTSNWSEIYTFKTAEKNVKDFEFIAIGDTQGYLWDHFKYTTAALDEAVKHVQNPAFILNTGDVVDSGYQAYQWNRYFKAMGSYAYNIPNFVAIGNHDTRNASNVQVNDDKNNYFSFYFNQPDAPADALVMDPDIYAGLSDSGKVQVDKFNETVFSYNYGSAHFVVINSGTYVNTGNETYPDDQHIFEAQRAWLENDLKENSDATWTIILTHEAFYNRGGGKQDRTYLADIVEGYGVDLVITGHSHIYTRTYPMKDGEIVTKENPSVIEKGTGTIYTTIGSTTPSHDLLAGKTTVENMYNIVTPDNTQPTYTTVSIENGSLVFTTRQIDGLVVDSFTIVGEPEDKEPEVTEPEVTEPEVTEPEATEPEATEPETTEPEVTEPEVTEPEATEPEVTEPEATEPEVTEPEVTEPATTEPATTEPATTEAEVTTDAEDEDEEDNEDEESKETADTKAPETTEKAEEKGGCGSSVSVAGIALVAVLGTCTVFVTKKKED